MQNLLKYNLTLVYWKREVMNLLKKQIAVFDFAEADCIHTAAKIREHFGESGTVAEYTVMQDFVYAFQEKRDAGTPFDMVFIGVDNMMGAETARNIREMSRDCPMFLVSEVSDFGLEGYRLSALDYLTKPVTAERVKGAVERIDNGPFKRAEKAEYLKFVQNSN
jgi:DNA-binding LytR/AlgR family response regulator